MLDELKNKLRITWNEDDDYLLTLIDDSKSYLSHMTNATFDFENEKWVKNLMFERCRYVYRNSADEFEHNYAKELKRLILLVSLGKVGTINE